VSRNVPFMDFSEPGKICSQVLGRALSISMSCVLTFHMRGFEPFSGSLSVIIRFSVSMSVHSKRLASPERMAVSFRVERMLRSSCVILLLERRVLVLRV